VANNTEYSQKCDKITRLRHTKWGSTNTAINNNGHTMVSDGHKQRLVAMH